MRPHRHQSEAEETLPVHHPDHPTRVQRRERVEKHLKILKQQVSFLFALIVFAMVVMSVFQQINSNRIEYDRYDLCVSRNAEIAAYNAQNVGVVPPLPVPSCGHDPRTD